MFERDSYCHASVEAGRARHSVRAETGLCYERRARSGASYLGWDPQAAMTDRLHSYSGVRASRRNWT
jgi:hypothetical protein